MSIFDRLNYNYTGNGVTELSDSNKSFMNSMPTLMNDWQTQDVANNDVGGYFKNPVANVTQYLRDSCNTIYILLSGNPAANINAVSGSTSTINAAFLSMISTAANTGSNNGGFFIAHTNRISGVINIEQSVADEVDVANVPHYDTAMSTGQLLMYITNQSDGIGNNAPIMGNFTSVTIESDLESYNVNVSSYYTTINNSLTITGTGTDIDPIVRSSNLSLEIVQDMANNINDLHNLLVERRVHDEEFFRNSRKVVDDYNTVKNFSDMGATANNLVQNYIGSDKLLTRINS
jgi:hypothetical protein